MRPLCGVLRGARVTGPCPRLSIIRMELESAGVSPGDLAHLKGKKLQPGHCLPWAGWDQFAFELAGATGTTGLL